MHLPYELFQQVVTELAADEGDRATLYDDRTGRAPILGRWENKRFIPTDGKVTVGIGLNLSDVPIPQEFLTLMFRARLEAAHQVAVKLVPAFDRLSLNRRACLINLAYNLGEKGLSGFKNTLRAINSERWGEAADGLTNSAWASQVQPSRRDRLVQQVRNG